MPPLSSGGVHLVQILNILEGFDLAKLEAGSADAVHLMAEAMKPAYADRAAWLGDPERFRVPVRGLTAKRYAEGQRVAIDGKRARPAEAIRPAIRCRTRPTRLRISRSSTGTATRSPTPTRSTSPTASAFVAAGTGVLLNNEMDDFSAKAGRRTPMGSSAATPISRRPAPGRSRP